MSDPRYKSGTSLEKTMKEVWRDRLLSELPDVPESISESFDDSLMKLDVWGMKQLARMISTLRKEAKQ